MAGKIKESYDEIHKITGRKPNKYKNIDTNLALTKIATVSKESANHLEILYWFYVEARKTTIITTINEFINKKSEHIESYLDFWEIAATLDNFDLMSHLSKCIQFLIQSKDVPTDIWIKGNIFNAKTLLKEPLIRQYDVAVKILKQTAQILPSLPISPNTPYDLSDFSEAPAINIVTDPEIEKIEEFPCVIFEETEEENKNEVEKSAVVLPNQGKASKIMDYVKTFHNRRQSTLFRDHMALLGTPKVKKELANSKTKVICLCDYF